MQKESLKGKRLLILGGSAYMVDPVLQAKSMGIYTIVTDWHELEKSPAKRVADEYWTISIMDYDQLVSKIKERKIDGILTGFTDVFLLPYQHICELAGLPCYATKQQFEQTLDKAVFKSLCRMNGVDVVPQYDLSCFNKNVISASNKVIIKPVDNSGSQGICLCDSPSEFDSMLQYALSYSQKKAVVLEKYMECDDVSFEYKIQDGEIMLSSICDRYIYKTNNSGSVTSKLIYPSKYIDDFMNGADEKVRSMFRNLGLRNGVLFMQAFTEEGRYYFYEMGYRLSGGRHYLFTENQNGTNALKELIHFALTGSMSDNHLVDYVNPKFKDVCCQLSVLCKSEKIAKITGVEYIKSLPEVIDATFYYDEGDTVGKEGTTYQILARIHIVAKCQDDLERLIGTFNRSLVVLNEKGENIIVKLNH